MTKSKTKGKLLILYLFSIYFITMPFYSFSSGVPQIADWVIFIIILVYLVNYNIELNKLVVLSIILITYIIFINSVWAIIFSSTTFLVSTMFYIFNIFILIVTVNLYRFFGETLLKFIFYGVTSSISIQIFISLFYSSSSVRETLFFNNPNQLGYYALLSLSILYLIDTKIKVKNIVLVIYSISCLYLAFLSLSKASMICTLLMIIFYLFIKVFYERGFKYLIIMFLVTLSSLVFYQILGEQIRLSPLYESVVNRLFSTNLDIESNLEERRYSRILEYPQYLIFGAGEGLNHYRFNRGEIHSTFFGFMFSYGIIGFSILLGYLFFIIKRSKIIYYIPLLFISLYGLSHNGIRQGAFWIILGILFILNNKIKEAGAYSEKNSLLLRKS